MRAENHRAASPSRRHLRVRDPRSGRSDDHVRPRRRDGWPANCFRSAGPERLYRDPQDLRVAEMIGSPKINVVSRAHWISLGCVASSRHSWQHDAPRVSSGGRRNSRVRGWKTQWRRRKRRESRLRYLPERGAWDGRGNRRRAYASRRIAFRTRPSGRPSDRPGLLAAI